jgi:hypothetical protein
MIRSARRTTLSDDVLVKRCSLGRKRKCSAPIAKQFPGSPISSVCAGHLASLYLGGFASGRAQPARRNRGPIGRPSDQRDVGASVSRCLVDFVTDDSVSRTQSGRGVEPRCSGGMRQLSTRWLSDALSDNRSFEVLFSAAQGIASGAAIDPAKVSKSRAMKRNAIFERI